MLFSYMFLHNVFRNGSLILRQYLNDSNKSIEIQDKFKIRRFIFLIMKNFKITLSTRPSKKILNDWFIKLVSIT